MAYHDGKFGRTVISRQLEISWDREDGVRIPVLLYTPDPDEPENHFHIPLRFLEATTLRNWLVDFLEDTWGT